MTLRVPTLPRRLVRLLAVALAAGCGVVGQAEPAASLRSVLTPEEFSRAGLDKLTPEELSFLSERLLGSRDAAATEASAPQAAEAQPAPAAPGVLAPVPAPAAPAAAPVAAAPSVTAAEGESAFGHEEKLRRAVERERRIPTSIESTVAGAFRGWSGRTVFTLANGQVWQQVDDATFSVRLQDPRVTIEKGAMGAFYLSVEGYGSRVRVRRIK